MHNAQCIILKFSRALILTAMLFFCIPESGAILNDVSVGLDLEARVTPPDSIRIPQDISRSWKWAIKNRHFDLKDTTIIYPRFVDFCLRTYRWAEKTFNTYDTTYVRGTGKHGKVRLVSDNWMDSYYFKTSKGDGLTMASAPYYNLGIQANYSSISLSYSVDINSAFLHRPSKHKKLGLSLVTARIYGDAYYWRNSGGTTIRRVGNSLKLEHLAFEGMKFRALGVMGFYIFNYKKFSLAAAYNLSNYQRRSAGSWMAGLCGTFYDTEFDFSRLPQEMLEQTQLPKELYKLHYNSVNMSGGYSFNWVIGRHWLFNTTSLPGIGLSFSFSNSTEGKKTLFSTNVRQMFSLTYVNRQFFMSGTTNFHGNLLLTKRIGFMSGIVNAQLSTGVRF